MYPFLLSLCREYVELVDLMTSDDITPEDLHIVNSQRQVTHDQLIEVTGHARPFDMYRFAVRTLAQETRGEHEYHD